MNADAMREYRYRVDGEGRVFHDGTEIVDPAVLRFFLRAMRRTEDGRWLVVCQGERNWFEVDGTPFVVQRARLTRDGDGRPTAVELDFAGGLRETLDPTALAADGGRLVCRNRSGQLARFGRVALQQLAPLLQEDGRGAALVLGDARYPIAVAAEASHGPQR
jgi:hypothetical protein